MNKNDFYKELMKEYTFDADKIKANAKKGRFARQKNLPMLIGITAAAAVAIVTAGTAAFTLLDNKQGVDLIQQSDFASMSAGERVKKALADIESNAESSEMRDVLVTFTSPLSPSRVQSILTAYSDGNVPVKQVYFADGSKAVGTEQVEAAFSSDSQITGAVVNCAGYVMAKLQSDPDVFMVEIVTDGDMDFAEPIDTTIAETTEIVTFPDVIATTISSETTEPVGAAAEVTEEAEETADDGEEVGTDEVGEDGTAEPDTYEDEDEDEEAVIEEIPDEPELPGETNAETGSDTSSSNDTVADEPVTLPEVAVPDGVTLPENIDKLYYTSADIGAESAFFVNETTLFVKTPDSVALYSFDGSSEKLLVKEECADAKLCWISENGGRLILSGVDNSGKRSRLLFVNADSESITDLRAEDFVMEGTITSVGYNEEAAIMAVVVKEDGVYYVCTLDYDEIGEPRYNDCCFESTAKVSLLAAKSGYVYLAVNDGALTQIFRVGKDGYDTALLKTYDTEPKLSKNLAFTHGVIAPSEDAVIGFVEIFDPQTESFIATDYFDAAINFGASRHSFTANGNVYTVSGGSLSASGGVSVIGKIEYRRSLSSLYAASASDGRVKITTSAYTSKAKSSQLSYGDLTDSASAEIREAVNGAIGVNNALALGKCAESGISSSAALTQCINAYYSEAASAKLKSRCGVSETGAFKYTDGGLTAISVSDTVLTASVNGDTASGVLYVRAGTFNSKTAYVSYNISLVKENGIWKVNSIIE